MRVCRASAREMGCKERAASTASPAGTKTAASSMRTPVSAGCASQLLKGATAVVDGRRAERLEAAQRRWWLLAGLDGRRGAAGGRWWPGRRCPSGPPWPPYLPTGPRREAWWCGADVDQKSIIFDREVLSSASPGTLFPMVLFICSRSHAFSVYILPPSACTPPTGARAGRHSPGLL